MTTLTSRYGNNNIYIYIYIYITLRSMHVWGIALHQKIIHFLVLHICQWSVNRVSIGSDNGLSQVRRQAIIWTNTWLFWIRPQGKKLSEILVKYLDCFPMEMRLKRSSAKWRPVCAGEDEFSVVIIYLVLISVNYTSKRGCLPLGE